MVMAAHRCSQAVQGASIMRELYMPVAGRGRPTRGVSVASHIGGWATTTAAPRDDDRHDDGIEVRLEVRP